MKNNKIRKYKVVLLVALALAALVCLCSCGGGSKAPDASGTISGTDVKWKYTASDSTLEISGTGAIPNYASANDIPWAESITSAKKIEVEEGITAIGNRAFYGASAVESVELSASVTAIGERSFAQCSSLGGIELPASLTTIGEGAFEGCSKLSSIKVGEAVTSMGERAFAFCKSLESAHIISPIEIKSETFFNCLALKTLVVHTELGADKVADDAFRGAGVSFADAQKAADPNKTVNITIKYVCSDGAEAPASVVITKKIGEGYAQNTPELEGYTADRLTVSGSAPAEDTEIVVTYTKKVEETTAAVETELVAPADDEKAPNYVALVIMVVVLAGVGVGGYFLVKSEKKNAEKARNQNKAKNRKQK